MWHDRLVMWFFVVCAAVAAALTVALVVGRLDGGLGKATSSLAHQPLPLDGPLTDDEVGSVRFDIGLRGYRMGQVDDVIDRLREELAAQRERLADYERDLTPSVGFALPPSEDTAPSAHVEPAAADTEPAAADSETDGSSLRPEWH